MRKSTSKGIRLKRKNHLWQKIISYENLLLAHKNASLGKKHYFQVRNVNRDLNKHIAQIQRILIDKSYRVSEYKTELINDKGKIRELFKLPYFPDRIIQWAIMLQIETIFNKTLCYHTCASLKGRGINRAVRLSKKYTKKEFDCAYCLKFDIKQFYPSINKGILKELLRTKLKDRDLLWLLDLIIDNYPHERGLPIGSYLSQYLANFYLSKFDHFLKEKMRLKYVVRYMDDICIYSDDKKHLHSVLIIVKKYLKNHLDLELKENYQVFPTRTRGVDFVGYRFFGDFTLLRKSIAKNIKAKMKIFRKRDKLGKPPLARHINSFYSYLGFLKHCNSRRFFKKNMQYLDYKFRKFLGKKPTNFKEKS